ncbi:TetR/AcrR family transcriptional regulator [Endozoicomonas sp.]|uniref:TetR/AcrR family transcriptional regulator n=1 Tax=Endozoicomonas sp. TaxID=1892382 RepID=UPI002884302A|nr:TetR/AcrR family transcriptional regulator [Endozoicomonas sp.]
MGRPRVRNRILAAARDLLETEGLPGLTTRAVAMHAGVTEASLFNNFGDKTGLLQALINEALPEQTTLIRHITEDALDDQKQINSWLMTVFEAAIAYFERVLPIAASSLTRGPTAIPGDRVNGFYTPRQMLSDRLRELKESNQIKRDITPELTAVMLMGTAMHTAMTRLTLGDSEFSHHFTSQQLAESLGLA